MNAAVDEWAKGRGLSVGPGIAVPGSVPLLTLAGEDARVGLAAGALADGLEGTLAHFTWLIKVNKRHLPVPVTVVLAAVPESIAFMPRLLLRHDESRLRSRGTFEGWGGESLRTTELESEVLAERYSIRVAEEQEDTWVRELFTPIFIDWLASGAPQGFSFELTDGALCGFVPGHLTEPAQLDALCTATARVAARIREESLEEEGRAPVAGTARTRKDERREQMIASVAWPEPPADMRTAISAYKPVVRRALDSYRDPAVSGAGGGAVALFIVGFDPVGFLVGAGAALVTGGVVFERLVDARATSLATTLFLREYARSRGLEEEDPRAIQAAHLRLRLPGVVQGAVSGRLGDADGAPGVDGTLALCANRANRAKSVPNLALITELAAPPPQTLAIAPGEGPADGFEIASADRTVCAYAKAVPAAELTAAGLDDFSRRAVAALTGRGLLG